MASRIFSDSASDRQRRRSRHQVISVETLEAKSLLSVFLHGVEVNAQVHADAARIQYNKVISNGSVDTISDIYLLETRTADDAVTGANAYLSVNAKDNIPDKNADTGDALINATFTTSNSKAFDWSNDASVYVGYTLLGRVPEKGVLYITYSASVDPYPPPQTNWDFGYTTAKATVNLGGGDIFNPISPVSVSRVMNKNDSYVMSLKLSLGHLTIEGEGATAHASISISWRFVPASDALPKSNISVVSFQKNRNAFDPLDPNASPIKYSNGDYELIYRVGGEILPDNPDLTLAVYWASGSTRSDVIGKPIATSRVLRANNRDFTYSIKMSQLINPPGTATHLVAILDNNNVLAETNEVDNTISINPDKLQENLSYELDSIAPNITSARTREQRVFLWISQYSQIIKSTAKDYHVDPRAIAGAIAWEALHNKTIGGSVLKKYGPGKIHYDEADAQAVQGTYKYDRFLKTQANLGTYLKSPEHAITYVAAIMNAYAFEAKRVGIELRSNGSSNNNYSDASILATYYNGFKFKGRQINLPIAARYFSERSQTTASDPLKPNDTMGQWVEYNLDFLEAALNTRP